MKQAAKTMEEAEAIVKPLMAENKWAITVAPQADGTFVIQWVEHKKYTALDGKEFYDEVWTTKAGEMLLIQDMEPEHAKNALRMLLRQERAKLEALNKAFDALMDEVEDDDEFFPEEQEELLPNFVLPELGNKFYDREGDSFSIGGNAFVAPEAEKKTIH